MTSENQRCKMVALLKSLKNIYAPIIRIHISESIFKSNKHIYKIRYQNLKLRGFIATYIYTIKINCYWSLQGT